MMKKIIAVMVVVITGCFLLIDSAMAAQVDADKIEQALSEGRDIADILQDVLDDPANAGQDPLDLLTQVSAIITTVSVQNAVAAGQDVNTAITETASQIIKSVAQVAAATGQDVSTAINNAAGQVVQAAGQAAGAAGQNVDTAVHAAAEQVITSTAQAAAQNGLADPVNVVNEVVNIVVDSATTTLTQTGSTQDVQAVVNNIQQGASEAANAGFANAGSDITVSRRTDGSQGMVETGDTETTAEATTTADATTTESTVATTTVLTTTSSSSSSSSSTTSETTASPAQ